MLAQVPDLSAILDTSGARKLKVCENLYEMEVQIGPAEMAQLMECGGKYPAAFRRAKGFCRSGRALGNTPQACLPNTPLIFEDQHDGSRKLVTLSGNKLSITSFAGKDRFFYDLGALLVLFDTRPSLSMRRHNVN